MGILIVLLVGGTVGWLATIWLRVESPRRVLHHLLAGIGGSVMAGIVVPPMIDHADPLSGQSEPIILFASLVGAVVGLVLLQVLSRFRAR